MREALVPSLRIIVPAYNETARIGATLRDYCSYFGSGATVVVVANGCTDDTVEVIRAAQERFANISIVEVRGAVGKGCAVRAGFETGSEPFVGFTDADGSTPAVEFDRLFRSLRESSADGCIGSRWLPGSTVRPAQGPLRRFVSRAFNLLTRGLFGLRFADTQCGSKVFRRASLAQVVDSLEQSSYAFDVELLWSLQRSGRRILELPIAWSDRPGSKVDLLWTSWSMLLSILRLRIQNSPLWRARLMSRIGSDACVPVRSSRRVLVFGSDSPALFDVVAALRDGGFSPVDARAELFAWQPRLRGLHGWTLRALFFAWYAFVSDRKYDAVVEVEGTKPWFVPAFSVKPAVLVKSTMATFPAQVRSLYRRCLEVDAGAASDVVARIALLDARLHRAVFVRDGHANRLNYRDADSGIVESLTLR